MCLTHPADSLGSPSSEEPAVPGPFLGYYSQGESPRDPQTRPSSPLADQALPLHVELPRSLAPTPSHSPSHTHLSLYYWIAVASVTCVSTSQCIVVLLLAAHCPITALVLTDSMLRPLRCQSVLARPTSIRPPDKHHPLVRGLHHQGSTIPGMGSLWALGSFMSLRLVRAGTRRVIGRVWLHAHDS